MCIRVCVEHALGTAVISCVLNVCLKKRVVRLHGQALLQQQGRTQVLVNYHTKNHTHVTVRVPTLHLGSEAEQMQT